MIRAVREFRRRFALKTRLVLVALLFGLFFGSYRTAVPQELAVVRFDILRSPIELVGDVRPQQYLSVIGRSAAWLGSETGQAELWVHPLKLATNFKLDFRIPDYLEPVSGRDVARRLS